MARQGPAPAYAEPRCTHNGVDEVPSLRPKTQFRAGPRQHPRPGAAHGPAGVQPCQQVCGHRPSPGPLRPGPPLSSPPRCTYCPLKPHLHCAPQPAGPSAGAQPCHPGFPPHQVCPPRALGLFPSTVTPRTWALQPSTAPPELCLSSTQGARLPALLSSFAQTEVQRLPSKAAYHSWAKLTRHTPTLERQLVERPVLLCEHLHSQPDRQPWWNLAPAMPAPALRMHSSPSAPLTPLLSRHSTFPSRPFTLHWTTPHGSRGAPDQGDRSCLHTAEAASLGAMGRGGAPRRLPATRWQH